MDGKEEIGSWSLNFRWMPYSTSSELMKEKSEKIILNPPEILHLGFLHQIWLYCMQMLFEQPEVNT